MLRVLTSRRMRGRRVVASKAARFYGGRARLQLEESTPERFLRLAKLAKEWRDQRGGTSFSQALMASVFEEAKKTDTDVLWLGVWEQNFRALAFYRQQGFLAVGEHTFQLGADRQRDLIVATRLN